jgi:hypothetical protein
MTAALVVSSPVAGDAGEWRAAASSTASVTTGFIARVLSSRLRS